MKKLIFGLLTIVIIIFGFNLILDKKIEEYQSSDFQKAFSIFERDKGLKFLKEENEKKNILLFGSSELGYEGEQNITNYFPNSKVPYSVDKIGHASVQNLLHLMKLGSIGCSEDSKAAIIVSLQWFNGEDIGKEAFWSNFSELQFYSFMNNPDIQEEEKQYVCQRILSLSYDNILIEPIYLYAKLYSSNSMIIKVGRIVVYPFYNIWKQFLTVKDKYQLYQKLREYKKRTDTTVYQVNWEEEYKKAEKQGKESCTNNPFYVEDNYYNTYIKDEIETVKDSMINEKLLSKEIDDFECFLKIAKQLGVKPYLIFMNTNGYYYDYVGIDRTTREHLYDKLVALAKKYDMNYLDLRDYEYEPYFMYDVMHLGWKGWLYTSEKIAEYFAEFER